MPARYTIGIDLGGTNIKGGVCDAAGRLVARHAVETQAERGADAVIERMAALVDALRAQASLKTSEVVGVGLGAPGPLSHAEGVVFNAPNLPGWVNVPVRERLARACGLPVVLENDANAAAFGEFTAGAGRDVDSLVMLTLGTGIGGGIVLDGQLWRGAGGSAAEIGHSIIVPDGRPCPCGQAGCLERYASANAVAERLVEAVRAGEESSLGPDVSAGRALDARDVLRARAAGDALAARIWDETCRYLALGCLNIEHVLDPDLIVLAGGLINAGETLLEPTRTWFHQCRWSLTEPRAKIALARLGTDAGVIGAAALARAG